MKEEEEDGDEEEDRMCYIIQVMFNCALQI